MMLDFRRSRASREAFGDVVGAIEVELADDPRPTARFAYAAIIKDALSVSSSELVRDIPDKRSHRTPSDSPHLTATRPSDSCASVAPDRETSRAND